MPRKTTDEVNASSIPHKIDRSAILATLKKSKATVKNFEDLTAKAQLLATELFLNQASICHYWQTEYMNGLRMSLPIDDFRTLKILSDVMVELCAYDLTIDPNKAIELLERIGYKIIDSTQDEP